MKKWVLFFSMILSVGAFSQNCNKVLVKGKVYDTVQPQGFYNLMIVNQTTQRGAFGRPNGYFSTYANENDQIALSIKEYETHIYTVKADSNCQFILDVPLKGKLTIKKEVIIYPLKSLKDIKAEREELSMRETRTVTGINVLQSPITALYERFSKTARSKRLVAQMEHQDNIDNVLKELFRVYISQDVMALEEKNFETFINFLNIDENFLKTASEYELIVFIKDKFEHFKFFHSELFEEEK